MSSTFFSSDFIKESSCMQPDSIVFIYGNSDDENKSILQVIRAELESLGQKIFFFDKKWEDQSFSEILRFDYDRFFIDDSSGFSNEEIKIIGESGHGVFWLTGEPDLFSVMKKHYADNGIFKSMPGAALHFVKLNQDVRKIKSLRGFGTKFKLIYAFINLRMKIENMFSNKD